MLIVRVISTLFTISILIGVGHIITIVPVGRVLIIGIIVSTDGVMRSPRAKWEMGDPTLETGPTRVI